MEPNPVLNKLGFSPRDRLVIIHLDDIGMCQASVAACAELFEFGLISSGAVMVPCPWFPAAAEFARAHPQADLGVHMTLNSEWETYRWAPVSTRDPASGLLDEQGFFHRQSAPTQAQADPETVTQELEAQILHALAAGIVPTHADTHMGTVAHPRFMASYLALAIKYRVPPMMLRLDEDGWRRVLGEYAVTALDDATIGLAGQMVRSLEEMGVPLLDGISSLQLDADPESRLAQAKAAFDALGPGITHFIIHAAVDTPELRAITPDWPCRVADYRTFLLPELRRHIRDSGVHVIGYRTLQSVM